MRCRQTVSETELGNELAVEDTCPAHFAHFSKPLTEHLVGFFSVPLKLSANLCKTRKHDSVESRDEKGDPTNPILFMLYKVESLDLAD